MKTEKKCPAEESAFTHTTLGAESIRDWWPEQLNLKILHRGRGGRLSRLLDRSSLPSGAGRCPAGADR
ncbi:hypothetical protein [Nitratifractor sp.]